MENLFSMFMTFKLISSDFFVKINELKSTLL